VKTHKHHIHYKSQGGSDDPSNLVELDFIEHARLHALDFVSGGPMFDCRHEGWPYLEGDLRDRVKQELSRRTRLRNFEDNPVHREGAIEKSMSSRRSYEGEANPFYGKSHLSETRERMRLARENINPSRRSLPIILIHPDGTEEWFPSAVEACKKHNLSKGNLCGVVNGKVPHTKGFRARRP
jgi:hypothetical protein